MPEEIVERARATFAAYRVALGRSARDPYPGDLPRDPTYLSWTLAALAPLPLPERQALLEAEDAADAAGHGHRPAARRAARDERRSRRCRPPRWPAPAGPPTDGRLAMAKKARRRHAGHGRADRAGVAFTLHEYDHDPRAASYGLEAAEALGVDPARVFKTLLATVDGALVVGDRARCRASSTSRRWPGRSAAARR